MVNEAPRSPAEAGRGIKAGFPLRSNKLQGILAKANKLAVFLFLQSYGIGLNGFYIRNLMY